MTHAEELRHFWRGLPYGSLSFQVFRNVILLEIAQALELLVQSRLTR